MVTLGAFTQTAVRFDDPSSIDFMAKWEDVRKGGYDADEMVKDLEQDGVWGALIYPSVGIFLQNTRQPTPDGHMQDI